MPVPERKRSSSIKITLTPLMHNQLREFADAIGQTPATVASVLIGQGVAQQMRTITAGQTMVEALADRIGPEMVDVLRQLAGASK